MEAYYEVPDESDPQQGHGEVEFQVLKEPTHAVQSDLRKPANLANIAPFAIYYHKFDTVPLMTSLCLTWLAKEMS